MFHIDVDSGIPPYVQLKEQVKVALALGKLRPGDPLPSIRRLEQELGVGRMLVRKAYKQLQAAGLLEIIHGKGAVVTGSGHSNGRAARKAEDLVRRFVAELRRAGIEPMSFSRLFYQRLLATNSDAPRLLYVDSSESLAREVGQQIQERLGIRVRSMSVPNLRKHYRTIPARLPVAVDYYYLEDARQILNGRRHPLFPISYDYAPPLVDRLRDLPIGSPILLLYHQVSLRREGTQLAMQELLRRLQERAFRISVKPIEKAGSLPRLARSRYRVILVSNIVWDRYCDVLERYPEKFWRLAVRLNQQSLGPLIGRLGIVM